MWARLDCKDDPAKLASLDRVIKERARAARAHSRELERVPCRLSIDAFAPPPADHQVVARQLVHATAAYNVRSCQIPRQVLIRNLIEW